jgi:hypothetical protein
MANVEFNTLLPGTPGVSHGSGLAGEIIRHATESWAGHAFIYVGNGQIIEGAPPVARIAPASTRDDAIWFSKIPLRSSQSVRAVDKAHALVGTPYDWPAYVGFALEILKIKQGETLDPVFKSDPWRVCSALVADCLIFANFSLDWHAIENEPGTDPNLVSPAMLLNLATVKGWL